MNADRILPAYTFAVYPSEDGACIDLLGTKSAGESGQTLCFVLY